MPIIKRERRKRASPEGGTDASPESGAAAEPGAMPVAAGPAPAAPEPAAAATPSTPQRRGPRKLSLHDLGPVLLLGAAHPRQAGLTALGLAAAAAVAGRPAREVGLVLVTVLVGQAILGWHNDLVDRERDAAHETERKPIAQGRLDPGTVWFNLACGMLLVVPLSLSSGLVAGSSYLVAIVVGLLGNVVLRRGFLSWVPWAASYALYPAFLSYGGWGGDSFAEPFGAPPEISMTVLAALLGVGVHVLRALPGLVDDNADGCRSLPLRIALKTGATKLLVIASVYTVLVLGALMVVGSSVGLAQ